MIYLFCDGRSLKWAVPFQIHFPDTTPAHISQLLFLCAKVTPALPCSLFAPRFTPRIELELLTWWYPNNSLLLRDAFCSAPPWPLQLQASLMARNIELFTHNKWCFQAELGEIYLQGSNQLIGGTQICVFLLGI